jgi:ring-1,2-phenylacetyl-CoA epoxidase subunit PaaE
MFTEEIADLKDRYADRFQVFHVLSQEEHESPLLSGRIDEVKLKILLELNPPELVDDWFLCGPSGLVEQVRTTLADNGVSKRQIHRELFHTGNAPPMQRSPESASLTSEVSARLDGRTTTFAMPASGSLLDAVLAHRPDAPFACKGGVCGTCRVRLVEGEVEMARNFALDPQDLEAGFRLACQSIPVSRRVVVDFDS